MGIQSVWPADPLFMLMDRVELSVRQNTQERSMITPEY